MAYPATKIQNMMVPIRRKDACNMQRQMHKTHSAYSLDRFPLPPLVRSICCPDLCLTSWQRSLRTYEDTTLIGHIFEWASSDLCISIFVYVRQYHSCVVQLHCRPRPSIAGSLCFLWTCSKPRPTAGSCYVYHICRRPRLQRCFCKEAPTNIHRRKTVNRSEIQDLREESKHIY